MFEKGHPAPATAGRPKGSPTTVKISKTCQRQVIRSLTERVRQNDPEAVELMVHLMAAGYGANGMQA